MGHFFGGGGFNQRSKVFLKALTRATLFYVGLNDFSLVANTMGYYVVLLKSVINAYV
jgi:hypothetical protein